MARIPLWIPAVLMLAGCGQGDDASMDPDGTDGGAGAADVAGGGFGAAGTAGAGGPGATPAPAGPIREGGAATIELRLKLSVDGTVVENTADGPPYSFAQGQGQTVPGLEAALVGMDVGDRKIFDVEPEDGFGVYDSAAIQEVAKEGFADAEGLEVGREVRGEVEGQGFRAVIVAIGEDSVRLDFNHPLAGKTLSFDVEVAGIR